MYDLGSREHTVSDVEVFLAFLQNCSLPSSRLMCLGTFGSSCIVPVQSVKAKAWRNKVTVSRGDAKYYFRPLC
jgi:hypothetical protein